MLRNARFEYLYVSLLLSGVAGPLNAAANESSTEKVEEMILLTVDKTHNKADLRTLPENSATARTLRTFKIATGKVDGDKERQGDNKTPEGIYFTQGTIPSKQLAPKKYGPLAIPLNFPNPMDQVSGKTGYGIWLHGVGDRRIEDARVTEGCVAFQNSEITSLTQWLQPNHGVVVIARDSADVNRPEDVQSVTKTSLDWIDAWAGRDMARYIGFYATDFSNAGKNKDAYESYKRAVFGSYKTMIVKISNLRVITHPKYALAMMNQDFSGDSRFKSEGRKMIYLRKDPAGDWKIVREMFDNFMMRPVQFSTTGMVDVKGGVHAPAVESSSEVSATVNSTQSL